jgi:hypothetical protein
MSDITISATFPGELLLAKALDLVTEVIRGQPNDVKAELWRLYLEDVKEARADIRKLLGKD